MIQKDYSLQTWKRIPHLILKLFICFSSSRIQLQMHLHSVFCRKCSILCAAKLRIRMCFSLKENGIFFENKNWTLAGVSLVGWVAMQAPGLRAAKYSVTPKPGFPLALISRFSPSYLYLCICIHTYIYIHLVFYRASFNMGTRWSLKPNVTEFILNAIRIVSISLLFFSLLLSY